MNSKKALERLLKTLCEYETDTNNKGSVYPHWYRIIKQDLEKLEKLKKKNKRLLVNKNVAQGIATKFKEENDKLKQALYTLIRKLDIRLTKTKNCDTNETYYSVCNENSCEVLYPEEYELLKEVLE